MSALQKAPAMEASGPSFDARQITGKYGHVATGKGGEEGWPASIVAEARMLTNGPCASQDHTVRAI